MKENDCKVGYQSGGHGANGSLAAPTFAELKPFYCAAGDL
jgi:hypothetical protein